jgi:23S rRNA pseudouridine1911/1915/1917 synthase
VRAHFAGPDKDRRFSLVELELKTGRTHQIRVHLSHGGYPIVGDDMYGGRALRASDLLGGDAGTDAPVVSRQALHAATLAFRHPMTHQPMKFTAPLPDDLAEAIRLLRRMDAGAELRQPPGATVDLGPGMIDPPRRAGG